LLSTKEPLLSPGARKELVVTKLVLAVVATFALASVASAADLPRKEPPPVATVGKAPIGKLPGKYPVGKYPVTARY